MPYGVKTIYQLEKVKKVPNWLKAIYNVKVGDIVFRYEPDSVKWKNENGVYINLGLTPSYTKVVDKNELIKRYFEKVCNEHGYDYFSKTKQDIDAKLMFTMFKLGWEARNEQ